MIVVKLQGGLGNQMFQYAVGKALATKNRTKLYLDHGFLEDRSPYATHVFRNYDLDIFQLQANRAGEKENALFFKKWPAWKSRGVQLGVLKPHEVIREPHFHFYPEILQKKNHLYLDGYWQSSKYFSEIAQDLRRDFQFNHPIEPQSQRLFEKIVNSESVCINVRRSDFLQNDFHPVCGLHYFLQAMDLIIHKISKPHFFVFSDDVQWCLENFDNKKYSITCVDHAHKGYKFGNYLQMMSACKHFIIPNSTYAWWAVWLASKKDNLVIAPKTWFTNPNWNTKDLLEPHWILMENE